MSAALGQTDPSAQNALTHGAAVTVPGVWQDWTTLTNTGVDDQCWAGITPMRGSWADVSVARYDGAGPTIVEGRSCCSSGVTGDDRDATADSQICESPTTPNTNYNACTDDNGLEDTCCAAPQATVTCKDGFSPIMEAYDDTDATTKAATGCRDNGGNPNKAQWHCCSCEAGLVAWKEDNPALWAGDGCNPRDGCTFEPRMQAQKNPNVMNLIAGLFMCVLGFGVSMKHIKFAAYLYTLMALGWSECRFSCACSHVVCCCDR